LTTELRLSHSRMRACLICLVSIDGDAAVLYTAEQRSTR